MRGRRRHGTTVTAVTLACALTCVARADARGDGYVTAGTGVYRNAFASGWLEQFSGGGEGLIAPHVDIGGDGSLVGGGGDAALAASLYASVHVREQNGATHMDPFVRAGYTRLSWLSETGGNNALNVGGGFNYWFSENRAWVVEFRAVAPVVSSRYWIASVGVGFR